MMKRKILRISKKTLLLLLAISMIICGCTPNSINKYNSTQIEEELSFNGLDDEKLHDYIIETLYSGMNSKFKTEDYIVNDITTVYISKEYIEEVEYNTESNIYFGYTLEELSNKFDGKRYVFEVDEDNQTTVVEFKNYENTYRKMIKNVAIGSGVILVCTTVSITTGGMINIIFAASAKTATEFAFSSASLSGVISSAVEYYKTGDVKKSLEKGMIDASEGFKWGAVLGSVTGGIGETIIQVTASKKLKNMNFLERGARAEARAFKKYGGREQVSYLNGKEVSSSVLGSTKPDLVRTVNGKIEAIEIKNYNLNIKESREHLIKELNRQVSSRVEHLPTGSKQRIVLDVQGRNYDKNLLDTVIKNIKESCRDIYPNLPVDIMT